MKDKEQTPSIELDSAPFVIAMEKGSRVGKLEETYHAGDTCPKCRIGTLDYDGLLNLACPACGFAIGGCFT